jgi:hypothetical protein
MSTCIGQGCGFDALHEMQHALKLRPIGRLLDRELNDEIGFASEASVEASMLRWTPEGSIPLSCRGVLRAIASIVRRP